MLDVKITEIQLNRKELSFQGDGKTMQSIFMPNPVVSFALRGELLDGTGRAHLMEDERDALLTLITRIEERIQEGILGTDRIRT